jgi:UDP-N-acetylmuramoyl-L-alanyl-D-glutamate--2,6-diaminopimelate ligase
VTTDGRFAAAHERLVTVATTGTNGKTTTTSMVAAIVAAAGEPSARVTTVGAWVGDEKVPAPTLLDEFLGAVERAVAAGVRTLALEVTSKALASGIARRWPPHVGVFTNLTRDHMDVHGSPEAYLAAKAQLFMALPPGGVAVLNADDPAAALLAEVMPAGVRVERFSVRGAACELAAAAVEVRPGRTRAVLVPSELARELGGELVLGVTGGVHAQNALGAALAARAAGYAAEAIRTGLAGFRGVPGRFEAVGERPLVVVDYAHTPDGLVGTLATARELCGNGRVICVFGCGGDRDAGKRPEMGQAAVTHADVVLVTSDNPRQEDPLAIIAQVLAGAEEARASAGRMNPREVSLLSEPDRAAAIRRAIELADDRDVVVVAGKGHERVQWIGSNQLPFSDVEVASSAALARSGRKV